MAIFKNTLINDTGYIQIPSGTTAQRPASPSAGYMRWNTTNSNAEIYNGSSWVSLNYATTGPNIITDSLLLYYDLNNTACWDGTSSTVYDLTVNNHDATLYNSPSYSTNSGYKVLETNGTNSYLSVSTPNLSSTNYTVMVGSRYTTTGNTYNTNNSRLLNAVGNNWLLGHWYAASDKHYAEGWITPSDYSDGDTNWGIHAATGNIGGDQYSYYKNNSAVVSNSSAGSQGPSGFAFGRAGYYDGEHAPGQLSFLLVYDKILTSTEMTQNYNAFKDRLGL